MGDAGRAELEARGLVRLNGDAGLAEGDAARPALDAPGLLRLNGDALLANSVEARAGADARPVEGNAAQASRRLESDARLPELPESSAARSLQPKAGPHPNLDLDQPVRASLATWAATRLGMIVLAWISAWLFVAGPGTPGPWLARWDRWDEGIFVDIARHWYFGPGSDPRHVAFFPGFPVAMWLAHLVVWNWVAAGLVVSAVAGAVATVALGRLAAAEVEGVRPSSDDVPGAVRNRATRAASNATLFFALAPAAVFLTAGYSESLFAAFAFSAWVAARRDRWGAAAVLAAAASAVRVNGLFLATAIALEFLLAGRERRRWRQAPLLAVPVLPVAAYVTYLHHDTGDWFAWQHAQAAGWFRTFRNPKYAWDQTWRAAFGASQAGHTAWVFQLELVAVLVGLVLTTLLLLKRRWPEALYVALSLLALGTTTWFMSVPRAMLLWWPLWTILGAWAARRPMVRTLYVCCVAPIMAGVALLFLSGQWAG